MSFLPIFQGLLWPGEADNRVEEISAARPHAVVVSPPSQVLVPYLLHRLSPRLAQPVARVMTKVVSRG
jgi:hypothetical protein